LAFVTVHNRIPVLFVADEKEAVDLIYAMANQVQNGIGLSVDPSSAPPATPPVDAAPATEQPQAGAGNGNGNGHGSVTNLADLPEQIVAMIPDVGSATARALLKRFGSLKSVFGATVTDLTRVDGLGPKKAKKIAAFLAGRQVR
jgi:ERCC4-type nuclease